MSRVVYVGMDVDKEKIIVAKLGAGSEKSTEERVIAAGDPITRRAKCAEVASEVPESLSFSRPPSSRLVDRRYA